MADWRDVAGTIAPVPGTPAEVSTGQPPGRARHPALMTPEERAQWFYDNINSEISLPQWQAWANKADPGCPANKPFRTDKRVSGGNQNECVETPDNCPNGTQAYGQSECIPGSDPRIQAAEGVPGAGQGAAGAAPQIGIQDLLTNMTFQRMFGNLPQQQLGQVGGQNLFNLGNGQQARVLEGGAMQWGVPGGLQGSSPLPAPPGSFGSPAKGTNPATPGIPGMVTNMVQRRRQPQQRPSQMLGY